MRSRSSSPCSESTARGAAVQEIAAARGATEAVHGRHRGQDRFVAVLVGACHGPAGGVAAGRSRIYGGGGDLVRTKVLGGVKFEGELRRNVDDHLTVHVRRRGHELALPHGSRVSVHGVDGLIGLTDTEDGLASTGSDGVRVAQRVSVRVVEGDLPDLQHLAGDDGEEFDVARRVVRDTGRGLGWRWGGRKVVADHLEVYSEAAPAEGCGLKHLDSCQRVNDCHVAAGRPAVAEGVHQGDRVRPHLDADHLNVGGAIEVVGRRVVRAAIDSIDEPRLLASQGAAGGGGGGGGGDGGDGCDGGAGGGTGGCEDISWRPYTIRRSSGGSTPSTTDTCEMVPLTSTHESVQLVGSRSGWSSAVVSVYEPTTLDESNSMSSVAPSNVHPSSSPKSDSIQVGPHSHLLNGLPSRASALVCPSLCSQSLPLVRMGSGTPVGS
eukprot:scaffold20862_cov41-Phaeocystis_antarctica.AAC.1